MLTAHVARLDGDNPLANLAVGDLPEPEPRPGWSLVRVEAASLNHHDLWTLRGRSSRPVQPPQILGCDAAGVVVAHGPGELADAPPPGTPVVVHSIVHCGHCPACLDGAELYCREFGMLSEGSIAGSFAELVSVPTANLIPRPPGLDAVAAACLPTAYLTAYRMLFTRAALHPGDTVLVQGASGGVATASILLARAAGIRVIATGRDAAKREAAERLGADLAIASEQGAHRAVLAATDGRGVDAVIETVGAATWELSVRSLRPDGAIVVAGATTGDGPPAQLTRLFWRQLRVLGSTMGTRAELTALVRLVASGAVTPLVDSTVPLADAADAFARLEAGDQQGKIVLVP